MRCFSCDSELSDYEATLKSPNTGAYLDMCCSCLSEAGISGVIHPLTYETFEEDLYDLQTT